MSDIPFEFAEPGTDPTKERNRMISRNDSNLKDVIPWVLLLAAFIAGGYFLFLKPENSKGKASRPVPTATSVPTEAISAGNSENSEQSVASVAQETPTEAPETLTPSPVPPTATPLYSLIRYKIEVGGETIECWCNPSDGRTGDAVECLAKSAFPPPVECRGGEQ
jgi:hypothetical protein